MSGALAVLAYELTVYKRTWRGSIMSSFLSPLFFLGAMGVGLGALVNRSAGGVGGVSYLTFLAPALMTAAAMQVGTGEMSFPVIGKVYWNRIYESMLATPVDIASIVAGELCWLAIRVSIGAVFFFVVMAGFGAVRTAAGVLAMPVAVLTGLAFGMPMYAFMVKVTSDSTVSIVFRFLITPLFLLSGTFFPIERLPGLLQAVAWISPLTHGVALARGLTLGNATPGPSLGHLAVLLALVAGGTAAAGVRLRSRLLS